MWMINMSTDDSHYLARYREGDVAALEALVEKYRRPLFGFILRMTEGRDEAEDIFQETWIRAIRNLQRYRDRRLLSWLFRIAHNVIIDRSRKKKPACSLQDESHEGHTPADTLAAPSPPPDQLSSQSDLDTQLQHAVAALPPEQRRVFVLRMDSELSFKEIARVESIPLNTALARMRYAVDKLRATLAPAYTDLQRN